MRVTRISVTIPTSQNTHRKYLYNECVDLMNQFKFGGVFENHQIKFNSAPIDVLKVLEDLKIKFERVMK